VSDIDTAVVDSLKVLDLKWPIREADIRASRQQILAEFGRLCAKEIGQGICEFYKLQNWVVGQLDLPQFNSAKINAPVIWGLYCHVCASELLRRKRR
jgi:hypothetical protein